MKTFIHFNNKAQGCLVFAIACFSIGAQAKHEEPICWGEEYLPVVTGKRCPKHTGTTLFRTPNYSPLKLEECAAMCDNEADCKYFSFGKIPEGDKWSGVCIGCTARASDYFLDHEAYDTYKICRTTLSPTTCVFDECNVCNGSGKLSCCDGSSSCDPSLCPTTLPVSVCIAMDESGSICKIDEEGCPNWHKLQKDFAHTFIQGLTAVTPESLFGVVSFARQSTIDLPLSSAELAMKKIDSLEFRDGWTNTQSAIEQCRVVLEDAPAQHLKYMVLISDGLPTNNIANVPTPTCDSCKEEAMFQADLAKSAGMYIISIGVKMSSSFSQNILMDFATSPDFYFAIDDQLDLTEKIVTINRQANNCAGAEIFTYDTNSPTPCNSDECGVCNGDGKFTCCDGSTECDPNDCPLNKPVSICFAMDESGSVCKTDVAGCPNWNVYTKGFAKRFIRGLDAISDSTFAVVSFARKSTLDIALSPSTAALETIDSLEYRDGFTNTQAAIEQCRKELENAPTDHTTYLVLITDGLPTVNKANDRGHSCDSCIQQAQDEANLSKAAGDTIITVGVKTASSREDVLIGLASSPDLFISVSDFHELDNKVESVRQIANVCAPTMAPIVSEPSDPPSSAPTPCPDDVCGVRCGPGLYVCCDGTEVCDPSTCRKSKPVSVCIALDESGSVCKTDKPGCPNWNVYTKGFAKTLIQGLDAVVDDTLFSIVSFARKSNLDINLSPASSALQTVDDLVYRDGWTNTQGAIEKCRLELLNAPDDHLTYLVLVTDGLPTINKANEKGHSCDSCKQQARDEANLSKAAGDTVITVGVLTGSFNPELLTDLASTPDLFFPVNDFNMLQEKIKDVGKAATICADDAR